MDYILMADDDPDDQDVLKDAFTDLDTEFPLSFVSSGPELLFELNSSSENPALILLDLNMPKMSGLEVLDNLKANPKLSEIPVIVYTTSTDEWMQKQCLSKGAIYFFSKPSSFSAVSEIAEKILGFLRPPSFMRF